jgi:hypothetical protein
MGKRKRSLGLFNMSGNRENRKVLEHVMNAFGGLEFIIQLIESDSQKLITFLGETFNLQEQKQEVKIYLARFFEVIKFEFTKENRPPLSLKYFLEEERIEIVFDMDCDIVGTSEQEYIKELEEEIEALKSKINAT